MDVSILVSSLKPWFTAIIPTEVRPQNADAADANCNPHSYIFILSTQYILFIGGIS